MTAYKMAFSSMRFSEKIPQGSPIWRDFNASFQNMDIEPIEAANLIYLGHPFTTWHKNNWRDSKNYILGQAIGLDFDTEDENSTIPHLLKDKFVQKFGGLIYTTPSHTTELPRARVVFFLDTPIQQPANYSLAAAALLWLFGTADRQCKDAARFFYGSTNCELEFLNNELPLFKIKSLIQQYQATGQTTKRKYENNYQPSATQAEAAAALKVISPWAINYDQWLSVLMGIHAEFGDSGLQMAQSWADGKDGEVERKWKSFNSSGNTTGSVTIASLFAIAKEHGWKREIVQ